jgi:hypothetical protein
VKKKFERMEKNFEKKASLDFEGSNLSGLEDPNSIEKMLKELLKDKHEAKDLKENAKLKEDMRQTKMLQHEKKIIKTSTAEYCAVTSPTEMNSFLNSSNSSTMISKVSPPAAANANNNSSTVSTHQPILSFEEKWLENQKIRNEKHYELLLKKTAADDRFAVVEANQAAVLTTVTQMQNTLNLLLKKLDK